jgi:phosphate transport system substrate-binding protein
MYKNIFLIIVLTVAANSTFSKTIRWTGCGVTRKAFMQEIANAYKKKTGIEVVLSGGGATKGIRNVQKKRAEVGGSCRHHLNNQYQKPIKKEKDVKLVQVAWDGVVIIVNRKNPVDNISYENLMKIIDGKITNWKEIGGNDAPISFISRYGKQSGVGHMFRLLSLQDPNYKFRAKGIEYNSTGPIELEVGSNEDAIAIDGISSAKKSNVKILKLDGVDPTNIDLLSNGNYGFFRPLYLTVHKDEKRPEILNLVEFILSEEGQKIIANQGTVNLKKGRNLTEKWIKKKSEFKKSALHKRQKLLKKLRSPMNAKGAIKVENQDVAKLLKANKTIFIDVRTRIEYAEEHLPNAININYNEYSDKTTKFEMSDDIFNLNEIRKIIKDNQGKSLLFYCNGGRCWKSYKAVRQVVEKIKDRPLIYWYRDGLPGWRKYKKIMDTN